MKRLLFFFAALLCCVSSFAQMNFVATLQHNDSIVHYYGQDAFNLAYNDAADGDVITLSEGKFNFSRTSSSNPMSKSIIIRGAGYTNTIINNDTYIVTRSASLTTRIEGISMPSVYIVNEDKKYNKGRIEFIKCKLAYVSATGLGTSDVNSPKVYVYNSILNGLYFGQYTYPKYNIVNSFILNPTSYSSTTSYNATNSSINFDHCVIEYNSANIRYTYYMNFYNCIFAWNSSSSSSYCLYSTATATNCLSIGNSKLFSDIYSGSNNKFTPSSISAIFKTYSGGVNDGETFELVDDAKTTYLGDDNTQIGMHGGSVPYDTKLQYPIVTKLITQPRTTKDGKLTIDVQVDGK